MVSKKKEKNYLKYQLQELERFKITGKHEPFTHSLTDQK